MSHGALHEAAASKRRRISVSIPKTPVATFNWVSKYNLEGKVTKSSTELGDGASSRVYLGSWNGAMVAVKELKMYVPRLALTFVKAYESLFNLSHPNIAQVLGICPQTGLIILEYCSKSRVNDCIVTTPAGLLLQLGNGTPMQLRILALTDTVAGVQYLHNQNIVHGDIKPQNILVCGAAEDDFIFKVTDYACNMISGASHNISSKSASFKQLMTPGYLAPELISDINFSNRPTEKSDVYSLAILIFEVVFCTEAWPVVSMKLLSAVQNGHRPTIPEDSSPCIAQLIEKCWRVKPVERPNISEISQQLEGYLEVMQSKDLVEQDSSADHTIKCFDVPSTSLVSDVSINEAVTSKDSFDTPANHTGECFAVGSNASLSDPEINYITINNDLNDSENVELDLGVDTGLEGIQNSQIRKEGSSRFLYSAGASLPHVCPSRNGNESSMSVDIPSGSMSCCANFEPAVPVDARLQVGPQLSPVTENDSHDSTNDHMQIINADMQRVKDVLKITELKQFQIECATAVVHGHDAIVVQPTGCGKSLCFIIPAICFPGKVSLVVEPAVSVITNQVDSLQKRGILAVALGRAGGSNKSANYRRVFEALINEPIVAFCTPEYLFGTPATSTFAGTKGKFSTVISKKERFCLITIDEAHKIFDRMYSYRPAFNDLKQLKSLPCPIIAMSATLTGSQVERLQQEYLHDGQCVVLTKGVHKDNLVLNMLRYKRCRLQSMEIESLDAESDDEESNSPLTSNTMWEKTISAIEPVLNGCSTVIYLDFVKDVEEVADKLRLNGYKAGKYTGQMTVDDRKQADRKFLRGDISVLVATESYELGVDNPNVSQVIRIGCPRNLGVLLQELGRAGRRPGAKANGILLFNEYMDDKRLGLWLKSALDCRPQNCSIELTMCKEDVLSTYEKSWRFIYSLYHGKCLSWALSHFYGGVDDSNPPTCFTANAPLCAVCRLSDAICQESCDIQDYLLLLFQAMKTLDDAGFQGVTKTLLMAVLLQTNERYVRSFAAMVDLLDNDDPCWGCGVMVKGLRMSQSVWHKILYVAVHLGFVDLSFTFRPFDSHYEVHRKYVLSESGELFISIPHSVTSVSPYSNIADIILGVTHSQPMKKPVHNRGTQLKPRITAALDSLWIQGTVEHLKYLGFGEQYKNKDICIYFNNCYSESGSTNDPHWLVNCIQFSRSQTKVKEISAFVNGEETQLLANRSYCSGVKKCGMEGCLYVVSTKQKINRCKDHPTMALVSSGPCSCYVVYIYPLNPTEDRRRWFVVFNAERNEYIHNHPPPSEWKISPAVLQDITNMAKRDMRATPKDMQKGIGLTYQPMEASLAAASLDRVRAVVRKARKEIDKVDNDKVNPFRVIASFPSIKDRIDGTITSSNTEAVSKLVGKYQLEGDDAFSFGGERQYAYFQSPFQAHHWANAEVLYVDIDYTGCQCFPYLLNVVCQNSITTKFIACGRALLNREDAVSIGKALSVLADNVKKQRANYNIITSHKEILVDFADAEANAFQASFGKDVTCILRGCRVHFLRSAMRVAKLVNSSSSSPGYHIFMHIARRIPDESSKDIVQDEFDVLCGLKPLNTVAAYLPQDVYSEFDDRDTNNWTKVQTWTDWWRSPRILQKLSKAYSLLEEEDWDRLPGTTNPVESINRQSIPDGAKLISLKPLVEHIYLEDKRQAILQLATESNVTISYQATPRQKKFKPSKPPEKRSLLQIKKVPTGSRAIGTRVSIEFYDDDSHTTTTWFKGTVISYRKQCYVINFDGCGPEQNEVIKSLKSAVDKGELKIL